MDKLQRHIPFVNAMINKFKNWPEKQAKWERVLEVITSNKYKLGTEDIAKIDMTIRQIKDLPDNADASPHIKTENDHPQELISTAAKNNVVSTSQQRSEVQSSQARCGRSLDEIFARTLKQYFSMLMAPCSTEREDQLFAMMENALHQSLFQEIKKSIQNFKSTQNGQESSISNCGNASSVNTLPQPAAAQNENGFSDIATLPSTPTRRCSVVLKKVTTPASENLLTMKRKKIIHRRKSVIGQRELDILTQSLNDSFINKSVKALLQTSKRGRYKLRDSSKN